MFTLVYKYEGTEHRREYATASDARFAVADWQLTDWQLYGPDRQFVEGRESL